MLWEYRLEYIFIQESGQYWFINKELRGIPDNKTQIQNYTFLSAFYVTAMLNFRIGLGHGTWHSVHNLAFLSRMTCELI